MDENGEVIYGDMLLLIYGREILTRKPGATFIGEVKCSQLLYDELKRLGGNPIMYKTGHSLIKAKMKQEHAELAGEMSGHMFFADRYLRLRRCAVRRVPPDRDRGGKRQAAVGAACGAAQAGLDAGNPRRLPGRNQVSGGGTRVGTHFKKTHDVIDVDGVRVLFEHGWGLLRASNTQPVLVMRFEAESEELLRQYQGEMEAALEEAKAAVV